MSFPLCFRFRSALLLENFGSVDLAISGLVRLPGRENMVQ